MGKLTLMLTLYVGMGKKGSECMANEFILQKVESVHLCCQSINFGLIYLEDDYNTILVCYFVLFFQNQVIRWRKTSTHRDFYLKDI